MAGRGWAGNGAVSGGRCAWKPRVQDAGRQWHSECSRDTCFPDATSAAAHVANRLRGDSTRLAAAVSRPPAPRCALGTKRGDAPLLLSTLRPLALLPIPLFTYPHLPLPASPVPSPPLPSSPHIASTAGCPSFRQSARDGARLLRVRVWEDDALYAADMGEEAANWLSDVLGVPCLLVRATNVTHTPNAFPNPTPCLHTRGGSICD